MADYPITVRDHPCRSCTVLEVEECLRIDGE